MLIELVFFYKNKQEIIMFKRKTIQAENRVSFGGERER